MVACMLLCQASRSFSSFDMFHGLIRISCHMTGRHISVLMFLKPLW
jgi:hypothetical protein